MDFDDHIKEQLATFDQVEDLVGKEANSTPMDRYYTRPDETAEEHQQRMKREEDFLDLQAKIIGFISDKSTNNYYDLGLPLPTSFFGEIFGLPILENFFIEQEVLGHSLIDKIERHFLEFPEGEGTIPKRGTPLGDFVCELHYDFNPDIFYSAHTMTHAELDGKEYHLSILRKGSLRPGDKRLIVQRANRLLNILSYSEDFYKYEINEKSPWEGLIRKIQLISLRADPMQNVNYANTGKVIGWCKYDKHMYVESFHVEFVKLLNGKTVHLREGTVTLDNCDNQEKYGFLKGRLVRYLFLGNNIEGLPYGRLVSTSITPFIDDTLSLPAPK